MHLERNGEERIGDVHRTFVAAETGKEAGRTLSLKSASPSASVSPAMMTLMRGPASCSLAFPLAVSTLVGVTEELTALIKACGRTFPVCRFAAARSRSVAWWPQMAATAGAEFCR